MKFIVYRKSDGRIESYSDGPIDHADHLLHTTLDIDSGIIEQVRQGFRPFFVNGAIILKPPEGQRPDLRQQVADAKTLNDIKDILTELLT